MNTPAIAQNLASRGRGEDKMLVHMTPSEVEGLQALAMSKGGSLTINPETGLPEAGSLSDTFKAVLPTLVGAGIMMIPGVNTMVAPWMVGLGVGGLEYARTGDLGRGLSAGPRCLRRCWEWLVDLWVGSKQRLLKIQQQ